MSLPTAAEQPPTTKTQALIQAVKRIDLANDWGKVPCARKSLLAGIIGGSIISMIRFAFARRGMSSLNWGVWSFAGLSVFVWHDCRSKRAAEIQRMRVVADHFDQQRKSKTKSVGGAIPNSA